MKSLIGCAGKRVPNPNMYANFPAIIYNPPQQLTQPGTAD